MLATPTTVISMACTRCGACMEACPNRAIIPSSPRYVVDPDLCDSHRLCIPVCPEAAIFIQPKAQTGAKK